MKLIQQVQSRPNLGIDWLSVNPRLSSVLGRLSFVWAHARLPLTFMHKKLHKRSDRGKQGVLKEMRPWQQSVGAFGDTRPLGQMSRDKGTKKGEQPVFSEANGFHSHSHRVLASMLFQTNCHLFVLPSLGNLPHACFSHRPYLSWL